MFIFLVHLSSSSSSSSLERGIFTQKKTKRIKWEMNKCYRLSLLASFGHTIIIIIGFSHTHTNTVILHKCWTLIRRDSVDSRCWAPLKRKKIKFFSFHSFFGFSLSYEYRFCIYFQSDTFHYRIFFSLSPSLGYLICNHSFWFNDFTHTLIDRSNNRPIDWTFFIHFLKKFEWKILTNKKTLILIIQWFDDSWLPSSSSPSSSVFFWIKIFRLKIFKKIWFFFRCNNPFAGDKVLDFFFFFFFWKFSNNFLFNAWNSRQVKSRNSV